MSADPKLLESNRYFAGQTEIAAIAHELNQIYRYAIGEDQGDDWDEAPEWQRESVRLGVQAIAERIVNSPSQSHEVWMNHKFVEGWRYGATKDEDARKHPNLVYFHELPPAQRMKDVLFFYLVSSLLFGGPFPDA